MQYLRPAVTTYDSYLQEAEINAERFYWRRGEAFFNTLWIVRPQLADSIRHTSLDPWSDDAHLPDFLNHLENNWR